MKQKSIVIGCYATLNILGGIMGYVIAHSLTSLIASGAIACILFICMAFIWKGNQKAYYIATAIVGCLCLFFAYRFSLTYKLAPGGIMALISGGLFFYLMIQRKIYSEVFIKIK